MTRWDLRIRCPECGVARVEEWEGNYPPEDVKVPSECDGETRAHTVLQGTSSTVNV